MAAVGEIAVAIVEMLARILVLPIIPKMAHLPLPLPNQFEVKVGKRLGVSKKYKE